MPRGQCPDITGQVFGFWTAIERRGSKPSGKTSTHAVWLCRCICGTERLVLAKTLRRGVSLSCGCSYIHGQSKRTGDTGAHRSWRRMIARCHHEYDIVYARYGGAGVAVCERWKTFQNFFADMGERPPKATLDRIDNRLGYEPGNCRWATHRAQANNRRSNVRISYNGREYATIAELSRASGVNRITLAWRIRNGKPLFRDDEISRQ